LFVQNKGARAILWGKNLKQFSVNSDDRPPQHQRRLGLVQNFFILFTAKEQKLKRGGQGKSKMATNGAKIASNFGRFSTMGHISNICKKLNENKTKLSLFILFTYFFSSITERKLMMVPSLAHIAFPLVCCANCWISTGCASAMWK
jgi:hypothetical protein